MFSKCANSNICLEHLHSLPLNANAVNGWSLSCDKSTNQTLTDKKKYNCSKYNEFPELGG